MKEIFKILLASILIFLTGCGIVDDELPDEKTNYSEKAETTMTMMESEKVYPERIDDKNKDGISNSNDHGKYAKIFANVLNARENHNGEIGIVTTVSVNTIVEIIDEFTDENGDSWYNIRLENNKTGWIAGSYSVELESKYTVIPDFEIVDRDYITEQLSNNMMVEFIFGQEIKTYIMFYDLNNDNVDESIFITPTEDDKAVIQYNNTLIEAELEDGVSTFGLLDINESDDYLELFVLSDYNVAPHAEYIFYRVSDNSLRKIGGLNSLITHIDGSGKIYFWGGQLFESTKEEFNYDLVMKYYDNKTNSIIKTNSAIGKIFECEFNSLIVFKEQKYVYKDVWEQIDWSKEYHQGEYITELSKGDTFKLLKVDGNAYQIELSDCQIGWVGGFHFYID